MNIHSLGLCAILIVCHLANGKLVPASETVNLLTTKSAESPEQLWESFKMEHGKQYESSSHEVTFYIYILSSGKLDVLLLLLLHLKMDFLFQ